MTISDRIFEKLKQNKMTQKEFSEATGISQSTISEWKSKKTNPTSEKIMIICKVLDVTPEWLHSGIENTGERGNNSDWYIIDKNTEMGILIKNFHEMDEYQRGRLLGYMEAIKNLNGYPGNNTLLI
jgi:transcriptional regulator with XRE-family HTH domain